VARLVKNGAGTDESHGMRLHQWLGALAVALILAAILAPQAVRAVRDARSERTGEQLRALGTAFAEQRERYGVWPCDWRGHSGQLELGAPACRGLGAPAPRDAWGGEILAAYQRPTPRIPGAKDGVIVLISPGADGRVTTSRRRAIEGHAVGDDLVHVVTRDAR
jgi:type II secretory pathway pseudopilin PulG